MDTNKFAQQRATVTSWCAATFRRFVEWMEDRTDRELNGVQAVALAAVYGLAGLSALAFVGWLLYQLAQLVKWLFSGHAGGDVGDLLSALPVVHVAADPIGAWATRHAAGLPVSASTLLTVWAIGGAVLFVAGLAGARGARIAWPLYGTATAAMAWFGAAEPHRPIAAGLVALAWGLASILVLHRGGNRARTHITNVLPTPDREPVPSTPDRRPAGPAPLTPVE